VTRLRVGLLAALLALLSLALFSLRTADERATTPTPVPTPSPPPLRLALESAECAPLRPTTFEGRFRELGYIGYRECSGAALNLTDEGLWDLEVWVDHLAADGSLLGSCRNALTPTARVGPRERVTWSATCPVTAAQTSFAVRFTDRDGAPVGARDAR